jgi:cell division protein FtsB
VATTAGRRRQGKAKPRADRSRPVSALTRRSRIPLALAALFSLAILGTSFPASALLAQHRQMGAASAQLGAVQSENRSLTEQNHELSSSAAIEGLARQDYQLVSPGQTLYDVLPSSGKSSVVAPGGPTTGDPAGQPLVDPSDAPDMSPDPGLAQPATAAGSTTGASKDGVPRVSSTTAGTDATSGRSTFWSRVTTTLEFWK